MLFSSSDFSFVPEQEKLIPLIAINQLTFFMKKQTLLFTLLFLLCSVSFASAQRIGRWEKIGEKSVNLYTDRDVMRATHKGYFSKIKIHVNDNPVEFKKVVVKFLNGSSHELNLPRYIAAGGETRILDLPRYKRIIKEIVFYYKSVPNRWHGRNERHRPHARKATVSVWGRH